MKGCPAYRSSEVATGTKRAKVTDVCNPHCRNPFRERDWYFSVKSLCLDSDVAPIYM